MGLKEAKRKLCVLCNAPISTSPEKDKYRLQPTIISKAISLVKSDDFKLVEEIVIASFSIMVIFGPVC